MIQTVLFYALAAVIVVSAVFVVAAKNIFHAALFLILALVGVGGIYALLAADFLFAVQLMVYAGGIMVLLLFVILLSGTPAEWAQAASNERAVLASLFSLGVAVLVSSVAWFWPVDAHVSAFQPTTAGLGQLLMTDLALPFETVSLVLVVALVGAVYFSLRKSR